RRWVEAVENRKEMPVQIQHGQPPAASESCSLRRLKCPTAILCGIDPKSPAEFPAAAARAPAQAQDDRCADNGRSARSQHPETRPTLLAETENARSDRSAPAGRALLPGWIV